MFDWTILERLHANDKTRRRLFADELLVEGGAGRS